MDCEQVAMGLPPIPFTVFLLDESFWSHFVILIESHNPHWARVVGYGPFYLYVIDKEGLFPSSGYINRLMVMLNHFGKRGVSRKNI
jgi:hypothetical protein